MYQISGPLLKNCDRELPDRQTNGRTRIKATRCETLRTVTTVNSKKTHFDIVPQFVIDGSLKRSILIYHKQYRI